MLILSGGYGRDYKSRKALLADWEAEKDFVIRNFLHRYEGKPCNRQQCSGETVQFRFDGDRKTFVLKVPR